MRNLQGLVICALAMGLAGLVRADRIADNVRGFWSLDGGRMLAVAKDDGLYRLDPNSLEFKKVFEGKYDVRGILVGYRLGVVEGDKFLILDMKTGLTIRLLKGIEGVEIAAVSPDGNSCVVTGSPIGNNPNQNAKEIHLIDLAASRARKVFSVDAEWIDLSEPIDDWKALLVYTPDQPKEFQRRHRIDLKSLKVTVDSVPRKDVEPGITEIWTCPDGKTRVVVEGGKLFADANGRKRDLGLLSGQVSCKPNRTIRPDFLAVARLADTNKDGKIDRNEGDLIEIYLLDFKTLKLSRLADAGKENVQRDWSSDGRFIFWSRIEDQYCLYLYDTLAAKTRKLLSVPGWCTPGEMLLDGRLVITVGDDASATLCLLDTNHPSPQPVALLKQVPSCWFVSGGRLFYWGRGDDDSLNVMKLPPRASD